MERVWSLQSDHTSDFAPQGCRFGYDDDNATICEIFHDRENHACRVEIWKGSVDSFLGLESTSSSAVQLIFVELAGHLGSRKIKISEHEFRRLLQACGGESSFRHAETMLVGRADNDADINEARSFRHCVFFPDWFDLMWTYDPSVQRSRGIFWGEFWIWGDVRETLQLLQHQRSYAEMVTHPMFLAEVACATLGRIIHRDHNTLNVRIHQVESRTGFDGWGYKSFGKADGDFSDLSANMTGAKILLARNARIIAFAREVHNYVETNMNDAQNTTQTSTSPEVAVESTAAFRRYSMALKAHWRMQEIQMEYHVKRVEAQLTALFNLITKKDSNVSISLAMDSKTIGLAAKHDSTSMKTLAAVTMIFLPSTTVATIFAMPMFDWNAGHSGVKPQFWLYWVVAVPLTGLTLAIWKIWTMRQDALHKRKEAEARKAIMEDLV